MSVSRASNPLWWQMGCVQFCACGHAPQLHNRKTIEMKGCHATLNTGEARSALAECRECVCPQYEPGNVKVYP